MQQQEPIIKKPPKKVFVALKVDPWVKQALQDAAKQRGTTLSDLVRQLIYAN